MSMLELLRNPGTADDLFPVSRKRQCSLLLQAPYHPFLPVPGQIE